MYVISSSDWFVTHFACNAGRFAVDRPVFIPEDVREQVLAAAKKAPGISIEEVPSTDQGAQ